MAAVLDLEVRTVGDLWAGVAPLRSQLAQGRDDVEEGDGRGRLGGWRGAGQDFVHHVLEKLLLQRHRLVRRAAHLVLQLGQFDGGETDGIRHCLAVDIRAFLGHHRVGTLGLDLDEITEHVVVLDLQCIDAGIADVAGLQGGDALPRILGEGTQLVQAAVVSLGHEAAVASQHRQVGSQPAGQAIDQRLVVAQALGQLG
jgi:hypothetical protein